MNNFQALSYIHFFAAVSFLFLAISVFLRNRKSTLNQACSITLLCFFIWSFGVSFVHNPFISRERAILFENIASVGWISYGIFFILFAAIFSGNKRLLQSKPFWIFLGITAAIFNYKQWSDGLITNHTLQSFGWYGIWTKSLWPILFFIYYFSLSALGLLIIVRARIRAVSVFKRQQATIVFITGIVPLFLGTITNVVIRHIDAIIFPPVANIFILFWASGMVFAITKYRFLSITPSVAAQKIISTMTDMLVLVDLNGNIASINYSILKHLHYTQEELEGAPVETLFPQLRDPGVYNILDRISQQGTIQNYELTFVSRKGKPIPVSINASLLPESGVVIVARDIRLHKEAREALQKAKSELQIAVLERTRELENAVEELRQEVRTRQKAESDLRESEEGFKRLFEYAPDAYYIHDMKGTFLDGNRQAERIVGLSREKLIGSNLLKLNLLSQDQLPRAVKNLAWNAGGKGTGPDEFILTRKDESTVPVEISTYPLTVKSKKVVLGIARDITLRKRVEEEKKALEAQLRQAQKMEAIGLLAGGIAHDFNNALGAIAGYADLIKQSFGKDNPRLLKYASMIFNSSERAADLTTKLLAFARRGKFESSAIHVNDIIDEVIGLLERTVPKNIMILQNLNADPSVIIGDHTQIQNAILNLALNARDAMPQGGTLSFNSELVELDEKFAQEHPYHVVQGTYVYVTVDDTGIGMDEETKKRIFEPFFTTKEKGKGTGLGLASVYGTIKSHNGYIEVYSETGNGTSVVMYFPAAHDTSSEQTECDIEIIKGTGTILVVDDEQSIRDMASDLLSTMGYTVITCNDGVECERYYADHFKEIDVVIIDIVMPHCDGYSCFVSLKRINANIKALVSSGHAMNEAAQKILDAGALGFIQKPFSLKVISHKLAGIIGKKQQSDRIDN
ncbi:MAG: PAS domain S-box protein [Chitinivibrionales bacterium]|nr:PAS domain S-box protein [Chitinivibrionales bacterium]